MNTVRVLMACSGRGTLIIPESPLASSWLLLCDGPSWFKSFVREAFLLPAIKNLILEDPGKKSHGPFHFSWLPKIQNVGFACGFWVSCW